MLTTLRRLRAHFEWANEQALRTLREAGTPPADALRAYAHTLGAAEIWLARIEAREPTLAVWPELDLEGCITTSREIHHRLAHYLDELTVPGLDRVVTYRTTTGQTYSSTVRDILLQVFLHGTYHRGQIAQRLRQTDAEPTATDYIAWTRNVDGRG